MLATPNATNQPTVAQRLFTEPFLCSIPDIYFYGEKVIQEVGLYSSGDKKMDLGQRMSLRDVYLPIVGMAIHHEEGTPIRFHNPKCAVEIYDLIVKHLMNWKRVMDVEINYGRVPIDDLRVLEAFAIHIFPLASQFTSQPLSQFEKVDSFTKRSIDRLSNRLRKRGEDQQESGQAPHVIKVEPIKPLTNALAQRYRERGGKE